MNKRTRVLHEPLAPTPCDAGALGQRVSERSRAAADGTDVEVQGATLSGRGVVRSTEVHAPKEVMIVTS